MKIVIDIPEREYNEIEPFLNGETIKGGFNLFRVLKIIKNGTPLTPEQYKIMRPIESYHAKAMALGYIEKPLAWALHQVWQEVDKAESEEV